MIVFDVPVLMKVGWYFSCGVLMIVVFGGR